MSTWKPEHKIRELYEQWDKKNQTEFLQSVADEFGWTIGQAYMATEFLFRPKNYN